jgi:hypothetical protein
MDAALRPLAAQPEQRLAGLRLLEGLRQASHPGAAAMLARWAMVDARTRRPLMRRVLALAVVLVSAWVLVGAVREGMRYKQMLSWTGNIREWRGPQPEVELVKSLNDREQFLLFGDLSKLTKSEQMRALWDSAPDNPRYFAAYAMKYRGDHSEYPPDFLATARRLDPGNAWFTYHAAADLARDSAKKDRQSYQARKAGEAPSWKILDEAKLDQSLAVLREAGRQTRFVNRQKELLAERIPLLPQRDQISRVASLCYLGDHLTSDITMHHLVEAIAAKAWMLGEAGDVESFRQLLGDADAFMMTFGRIENPTCIEVLVLKSNVSPILRNLQAAAEKLGLEKEANRLKRIICNLDQGAEELKQSTESRSNDGLKARCAWLSIELVRLRTLVKSPPLLSDADLKPGRMVEHLLASRVALLAVWTLLGVGIVALAVYRFCLPAWLRSLAQRMNALLLPVDWAWMVGAGVVLPFGYVTVLMRCTPLGGQDWGLITGGVAPVLAADFLALALLMLVMPALIARWRLGRRAAAFGICTGRALWGWLAVAAGAAAVPLIGMTPMSVSDLNPQLVLKLALLAPLLLLIFASVVRALVLPFTRQFSRAVVALALIPAYACGMLWVMLSLPVYQAAQAAWERRDAMTELTADGITRYEGAVARQLLQEVRQVLELEAIHGVR